MSKGRDWRNISQEFHEIMLDVTAGAAHRGPSSSQGAPPLHRGPSTSQSTSSPQRPPPNVNTQPTARPLRSAFRSSDTGASAELKEKYGILQRGFITLEAKHQHRQEDLAKLREELHLHALHTDELEKQLEAKEKELGDLCSKLKDLAHTSSVVKGIIDRALTRFTDQLGCPVCSELLRVPHSLGCLHTACCACIVDSFQRHGAKCPICWQPYTQYPRENVVIGGTLSIVYELRGAEQPTLASLGLDPGVFVRLFQTVEPPPDSHQGDVQHQLQEVQRVGSTHERDERNVGGGDGTVLNHANQQAYGEGDGVSGRVAVVDVGGVATGRELSAVGPPNTAVGAPEDVDMAV